MFGSASHLEREYRMARNRKGEIIGRWVKNAHGISGIDIITVETTGLRPIYQQLKKLYRQGRIAL